MIGGILGALNGAGSLPAEYLGYLERQNGIELERLARDIDTLANRG